MSTYINGKSQSHYSLTAGSNNDTLNPQPDESHEGSERNHDIGVIGPGFFDHTPKFGITVGSYHTENPTGNPYHKCHIH